MLQHIIDKILDSSSSIEVNDKFTYIQMIFQDSGPLYTLELTNGNILVSDKNKRIIATYCGNFKSFEDASKLSLNEFNVTCSSSFAGAIPLDYRWDAAFVKLFEKYDLFNNVEDGELLFSLLKNTFYNRFCSLRNLGIFLNEEVNEEDLEALKGSETFRPVIDKFFAEIDQAESNSNLPRLDYGTILVQDDQEFFNSIIQQRELIISEILYLILKVATYGSIEKALADEDVMNLYSIRFISVMEFIKGIDDAYNDQIADIQNRINADQIESEKKEK